MRLAEPPVPFEYVAFLLGPAVKATVPPVDPVPNGNPFTFVTTSTAIVPSWQLIHAPEMPDAIPAPVATPVIVELVYT